MRLFRRVGDIVAANVNDLVDRFEDPEVMLRQAIREMAAMIEGATGAAARAVAGERLLSRDLADHERKARCWMAEAEDAAAREDDDRARLAIARAHEHEASALALVEQRSSATQAARALRGQVNLMRARLAEARRKLDSLAARRLVVEAGRALRGGVSEPSSGSRGFARFAQMRRRIEQAEAEADALAGLGEDADTDPDAGATSREQARRVEAVLAAIKNRARDG